MSHIDYYTAVGYSLELLAQSEYHQQQKLGSYFDVEIIPPLLANQVRFYLTPEGIPTAMATWAWISEEIETEIHQTGRALAHDEWTGGDRLFCNDWITPYNNIREVVHDMTHNLFPNAEATSVRRKHDGSVYKICRWTGVNLRKQRDAKVA